MNTAIKLGSLFSPSLLCVTMESYMGVTSTELQYDNGFVTLSCLNLIVIIDRVVPHLRVIMTGVLSKYFVTVSHLNTFSLA